MELLISASAGSTNRVTLSKSPLSIGRSTDNDLPFPDDPWLSRFHLTFERSGDHWLVKDCASRNGTVINSAPLREPHTIKPSDRICAGHLTIEVLDSQPQPQRPVVSFTQNQEEERATREVTLVTSLDKLLSTSGGTPIPQVAPPLGNTRVVGALLKAGQELAGHRPLEALFEVILNLALTAVNASRGVILTLEPNGELLVRASRGEGFLLSSAVRHHVIDNRASIVIEDVERDEAFRLRHSIVMHRVRSMMAVPLQTGGHVIGLIYVDNASALAHFLPEDLDLLTVMANVAAIRIEHARLIEIEQSEKLMESELQQASEIQQTLLPASAPSFPGFDLAGINICCRTVGGDYYDFLPYGNGRLALVLGDVSGKGMPAALLMSSLQARVQMLPETMPSPGQAVARLNRTERCPPGRFITFFFATLESDGALTYANAGHNYPLLSRLSGQAEELRGNGYPLGIFANSEYPENTCRLNPGDLLILYSDGLTEAMDCDGKEFGEQNLAAFVHQHRHLPCRQLVTRLVDHVRSWCGNQAFADDFTLLLVKRNVHA